MSTGSFFGDPWDDDGDPSQPQPFFGGPLQAAMRQQSAGWANPLLALAGQPSYVGSLASGLTLGPPPDQTMLRRLAAGYQPDDQLAQTGQNSTNDNFLRNSACTEASYQCLDNVTTPEFQRACVQAMTVCDEWLNRLRGLGPELKGMMVFPDKRTTVIAPGGRQEPYVMGR